VASKAAAVSRSESGRQMWSGGTRSNTKEYVVPASSENVAATPGPSRRRLRAEPIVRAIAPSSAMVSEGERNSTPCGCISTSCSSRP
jgi:hypothetical protein